MYNQRMHELQQEINQLEFDRQNHTNGLFAAQNQGIAKHTAESLSVLQREEQALRVELDAAWNAYYLAAKEEADAINHHKKSLLAQVTAYDHTKISQLGEDAHEKMERINEIEQQLLEIKQSVDIVNQDHHQAHHYTIQFDDIWAAPIAEKQAQLQHLQILQAQPQAQQQAQVLQQAQPVPVVEVNQAPQYQPQYQQPQYVPPVPSVPVIETPVTEQAAEQLPDTQDQYQAELENQELTEEESLIALRDELETKLIEAQIAHEKAVAKEQKAIEAANRFKTQMANSTRRGRTTPEADIDHIHTLRSEAEEREKISNLALKDMKRIQRQIYELHQPLDQHQAEEVAEYRQEPENVDVNYLEEHILAAKQKIREVVPDCDFPEADELDIATLTELAHDLFRHEYNEQEQNQPAPQAKPTPVKASNQAARDDDDEDYQQAADYLVCSFAIHYQVQMFSLQHRPASNLFVVIAQSYQYMELNVSHVSSYGVESINCQFSSFSSQTLFGFGAQAKSRQSFAGFAEEQSKHDRFDDTFNSVHAIQQVR